MLGAVRQFRRKPHPDAPHKGNPAKTVDEVAEAVRRGVAETDDPVTRPRSSCCLATHSAAATGSGGAAV